ncbi:MAG: IPTL-CTERM sorting domain-containing protein [Ottowia sp.]|uniref:IPTL-CTERM sorting domain-containing protein n=1 Tax=Ottowia sp. TaxID=1898956 RepID=UPI0039E35241
MKRIRIITLACSLLGAMGAQAASIALPGGTLAISATNASGASFTYAGTLTETDTLSLSQIGTPCLQSGDTYCTNGAGVLTVAASVGGTGIGQSSSFSGPSGIIPSGTWTYGALLMQISGVGTVQIWPTSAANGLDSATPPAGLTLPATTLAELGFPAFSQANPTITFIVADTYFTDNSGSLTLTQAAAPAAAAAVPTLAEWGLGALALAIGLSGLARTRRSRSRA